MIAVSIYCYLIKYRAKQKHLLPFHNTKIKCYRFRYKKPYFFNDIINIEHFNPNNIKKDEKSYKNILVDCIAYVTIKKYINVYSVNP